MFEIEVLNIVPREGQKCLRAFVDIALNGELTIKGFRLLEDVNGSDYWIAEPQTSYQNGKGDTKRVDIVEMSQRLKKQIREAIVEAYKQKA